MAMPDLQRYPRNRYLINNEEDIVISPGLKMLSVDNFIYCNLEIRNSYCREITI